MIIGRPENRKLIGYTLDVIPHGINKHFKEPGHE
jgi:hypothetical protein